MDATLLSPPMTVSVGKLLRLLPLTPQPLRLCMSVYSFITSTQIIVLAEPAMLLESAL